MFSTSQATAVWMTVAMLLAQAVCPGLASGCGCQFSSSSCAAGAQNCCCSSDTNARKTGNCPHCRPVSDATESEDSVTTTDGFQTDSVCHCGESLPLIPAEQGIPNSSEPLVKHLLDLIIGMDACLMTKLQLAPTPAPPSVPSSEELKHNHKQVVLCVWLT